MSWDTRRDNQGSTSRCPRDSCCLLDEKGNLPGHRPGVPGTPCHPVGFQKLYVIFSSLLLMTHPWLRIVNKLGTKSQPNEEVLGRISNLATCRTRIVRYPIRTSTKDFCDTIATSITRYEKYRCWASTLSL